LGYAASGFLGGASAGGVGGGIGGYLQTGTLGGTLYGAGLGALEGGILGGVTGIGIGAAPHAGKALASAGKWLAREAYAAGFLDETGVNLGSWRIRTAFAMAESGAHDGTSSPIPGSYIDRIHVIDMIDAPAGSASNAAGFARNGPWFWRQMNAKYPALFSKSNEAAIRAGQAPLVDDVWIGSNPTHQSFMYDKLIHHHIDQGAIACGLPQSIHRAWHGTVHPER
jgi:hypothetical protein